MSPALGYGGLSRFELDCLRVIAVGSAGVELGNKIIKDPTTGVGIMDELNERYEEGTVNHGRVYGNLRNLEREGYLSKAAVDGRTNHYYLEEKGEEALRSYYLGFGEDLMDAGLVGGEEA